MKTHTTPLSPARWTRRTARASILSVISLERPWTSLGTRWVRKDQITQADHSSYLYVMFDSAEDDDLLV